MNSAFNREAVAPSSVNQILTSDGINREAVALSSDNQIPTSGGINREAVAPSSDNQIPTSGGINREAVAPSSPTLPRKRLRWVLRTKKNQPQRGCVIPRCNVRPI